MGYLNKLSKYSELLNRVEVRKIVTLMLVNCVPESLKKISDNEIACRFIDTSSNIDSLNIKTNSDKSKRITLTIFGKDLIFEKDGENRKEITRIVAIPNDDERLMINKFICEKRKRGIIITEIREYYDWTIHSDKEQYPIDLYEYRYVFGNDNIKSICDHKTPVQFELINKNNINLINYNLANFRTDFEVHMKKTTKYPMNLFGYDTCRPTRVLFEGKDVSYCYDMVEGPYKVEAVHDLYNGIINGDNKGSINLMNLGLMTTDGFDLRSFLGFTDKENAFLGDPLEPTEDYKRTTKRIIKSVIGYDGEIKYDRDSLLNCICYESSEIEHKEENIEQAQKKVKLLERLFKRNNK